jgi:hypothetical protein
MKRQRGWPTIRTTQREEEGDEQEHEKKKRTTNNRNNIKIIKRWLVVVGQTQEKLEND